MVFPARVIVLLRLHDARIYPEKPLPTQTTVELIELGAFTRAIGMKFSAQDAQHSFSALGRWSGTFLRHAVNRATLFVILQPKSAAPVLFASLGQAVTRWHFGAVYALRASWMHFLLRHYALVLFAVRFPAEAEGNFHGMLVIGSLVEVLQRFHALVPRARRRVAVIQNGLQQILAFRVVFAGRVSMMACAGQNQFHRLLDLVDV